MLCSHHAPPPAGSTISPAFSVAILRQQSVWSLAGWQCLRTVFWGAASLSMPFLLFEFTRSQLVVGVFQLVANLAAMAAMLTVGALSDRGGIRRRRTVTITSLAALALSSALLAISALLRSPSLLFGSGVFATAVAWTISGQVTPLAKAAAEEGQESQLMGIIVSAWAVGALGGAQTHGRLCETAPAAMFGGLAVVMVVCTVLAKATFDGPGGLVERRADVP